MGKSKKKDDIINIKSVPVVGHIGVSKYINDDWGTISFVIPRNQIQLLFGDLELRHNCIYFLFGFESAIEKVYVGQAKKRNNGESVLARLREHDKNTSERYYNIWDWAIVVTGKDDTWSIDDLHALEHLLYNEIPLEQNLNGNNPNSGGVESTLYEDKVHQIKSYVTAIGFSIFNEDLDGVQVTSEVNESNIVEDLHNGLARIPEIVTPHKVVKDMCDMLPKELWNDRTVFLDPACKGGEYLREIYDRLMETELLIAKYPDEFERSNHILGKQIYGIALSQVSLDRTTKKLRGYDNNLRVIPNYIQKLKGIGLGSKEDGSRQTIQDILNKEFNREMKIDVVIGNPPYQELTGGGQAGGKALWHNFIDNAKVINTRFISMITPSRWFTGGSGLNKFRIDWINDAHIRRLVHYPNANYVFPGTSIAGGVSYFLWDRDDCQENM